MENFSGWNSFTPLATSSAMVVDWGDTVETDITVAYNQPPSNIQLKPFLYSSYNL